MIALVVLRVFTFRRQTAFGGKYATTNLFNWWENGVWHGGKTAFGGKRTSRFGRLINIAGKFARANRFELAWNLTENTRPPIN